MTRDLEPDEWARLSPWLDELLELSAAERRARAAGAFPGEPGLKAALEALLGATERAGGFLETPLAQLAPELFDAPAAGPPEGLPGACIGPWRLLRELGRGGMGVVYLAERAGGEFRQRSALKLARGAVPSAEALARFRRERRILARLEHPHIARLLDGGVSPDGRPYFAMEYVEGRPLVAWCDERRAGLGERLRLFVKICAAVQHAHASLVVHRDLKPANVLVDGRGEPRLLDFGIAKLLAGGDEPEPEALTLEGAQPALTPEYAAPEQKRGEAVTTATDVYALGLLLFELLHGRRPDQAETVAPPAQAARLRATTPRGLKRALRGDLETILQAALRDDPRRRYGSADALARDVERHLAGLPVSARPDTLGYRLGSFARRHRGLVAAAALLALALGAGLAATLWQARARAREARKAREVGAFLAGLFRAADPDQTRGRAVSAQELLARGAQRIERELVGQPDAQAELLTVLGGIHGDLGLYDRAAELLARAVALRRGGPDGELAQSLWGLGRAQIGQGRLAPAEASLREALVLARRAGARAPAARVQTSLGFALRERGAYDESERLLREALAELRAELGEDHEDVADGLAALADLRHSRGDYSQAAALLRDALAVRRRGAGAESWQTASMLNRLGAVLRDAGRLEEAAPAHEQALATLRAVLGDDHPEVATTLHDLAVVMLARGEDDAAARLHGQAVEIYRRRLGPAHPWLATSLHDLARVHLRRRQPERAEPLLREALAIYRQALGPDHEYSAMALNTLAAARVAQGDRSGAEPLLRESLRVYRGALPRGHAKTSTVLAGLGELLLSQGRLAEAEALSRESLESRLQALGPGDRRTVDAQLQLAACLVAQRRFAEAEGLLLAAHGTLGHATGPGGPGEKASAAARLAELYERWGKPEQAARFARAGS